MSSSVGRNSLIMASGTAASRVTGQIRTILLAWALGTTGYAANAYQAGSMIPQVIYTLVSGGIFNAVLVPQIVRTLKAKDAETKLNKLITLAITMLLAVTILMALCTPLLTKLYVNGSPETMALATSFTLWCMPQIFFYGLYTVVGQILAAKDHFTAYAWSSVGANIISCIGFGTFIALFGRATEHPLDFWTADKIALTAGTWTLGVAFQALVLFIPLTKIGLKYRPINPLDVAGNASYQNAYTIYMLPYSLIAVSLATAIFPKISRAVADHNIAEARIDLSQALRNMGVIMCYFAVAFVVMPVPIILALLPSVSVREAILMAGPLVTLGVGLPFASAYLIIQRTFYAFEDGKSPFIFMLFAMGIQAVSVIIGAKLLPPTEWTTMIGMVGAMSYILPIPILYAMLRKRFENNIDGPRIAISYLKSIGAAVATMFIGVTVRDSVYQLVGAQIGAVDGHMNWIQAVACAALLAIVAFIVYVGMLRLLRSEEFKEAIALISSRIPGLRKPTSPNDRLEQDDAENGE